MSKVAITYSPVVGGSSVISLKESFQEVGSEIIDADYRQMMADIPEEEFNKLYATPKGRQQLFAHAKAKAVELLKDVDCLALSGSNAMIDPELFNKERQEGENYDFSRTIVELALAHVATERGMPIFGVCAGHQVIAVHGGGEISDLNADKLEKQRYMNYETVKINKDTMLAQIFWGKELTQNVTTTHYEGEFFGAHSQVVSKLGKGFKQTAVASDNQSIEAAENEFGVPILATQFHPEVGAKGIPEAKFIYQRTEHEIESSLKIFDFFNKAGDAYHQKKSVMDGLKSLKPKDDNRLIKPSVIKTQPKLKKNTVVAPVPKKKPISFNWQGALASTLVIGTVLTAALFVAFPPAGIAAAVGIVCIAAIGAATGALAVGTGFGLGFGFGSLVGLVMNGLSTFLRNRASDCVTIFLVAALREKEATTEEMVSPEEHVIDSSYSVVLLEITSPGEMLRSTPRKLWKEQNDDEFGDNTASEARESEARESEAREEEAVHQIVRGVAL